MKTIIHGTLEACGTPPGGSPRALVSCTEKQIRAIKVLAVGRPCVVLTRSEWDALLLERDFFREDRNALAAQLEVARAGLDQIGSRLDTSPYETALATIAKLPAAANPGLPKT